ncbi:MAG TPA: hypothetical protein VJT31_19205 [Rugosimonospora sp.]|nr:hypothetical protein [Rugosimonospora sp.]
MACDTCSGGWSVGWVGYQNTLQFNGVISTAGGALTVTIYYLNGGPPYSTQVSANGGAGVTVGMPPTGSWTTVGSVTVTLSLHAGANRILLSYPYNWVPPLDRISFRDPA